MSKHLGFLYGTIAVLFVFTMCLIYGYVKLEARVEHAEWVAISAAQLAEEANARAVYANRVAMRSLDKQVFEPCVHDEDKVAVTECEVDVTGARVCRLTVVPVP